MNTTLKSLCTIMLAPVLCLAWGCGGQSESTNPPAASMDGDDAGKSTGGDSPKGNPGNKDSSNSAPQSLISSGQFDPNSVYIEPREIPRLEVSEVALAKPTPNPVVIIKTSLGRLIVELDAVYAPVTVDNFLSNYAEREFYDQTIFHYVQQGFTAAAGGFSTDLRARTTRGPIFSEAGNGLKNVRGTIAMARNADDPHSATSQFFFNIADNPSLDHVSTESGESYGYCVFGRVVEGLDVLDQIGETQTRDLQGFPNVPVTPIVIESIERLR